MTASAPAFAAIVVAAGAGTRVGGGVAKQWRGLLGKPVARWAVEALARAGADPLVVVVRAGEEPMAAERLGGLSCTIVAGAETRTGSVRRGLAALGDEVERVLIHDAARPLLDGAVVGRVLDALDGADAAAPALPVADTLKRSGADGVVKGGAARDGLWRVQTPQGFDAAALRRAYAALPADAAPTDDLAVVEAAGGRAVLVAGDPKLLKLTYEEDFAMAERLAEGLRVTRVGLGVDAHRFGPGDGVWLCGIKIPSDLALIGHSDADAGLHAITDAVLGAIGAGDIGDHFPPSDPQWRGAPSDVFLRHAVALVDAAGGRLVNVDVTLICERPKIKPHREAMRARVAEITGLPVDRVSVKATTTEAMGFTGREEGLAAQALATVDAPA